MANELAFTPKTLEEHREYLHEIVKLQLWFVHYWLEEHPEENFVDVLRGRVDIYRKTDVNPGTINPNVLYYDDPRWVAMEKGAEKAYERHKNDRAAFEAEAFELFRNSLDDRCERDYADQSECPRYQCGFLRHDLELRADGKLGFHIANFCSPRSFFDYPDYMKGCFLMLLDKAEHTYGTTHIATGTWLNSMPRWCEWFPEEWKTNMSEPNTSVKWHYGFWGQFITARKTFNFAYGKILRSTGKMPFYPRASFCSISAMRSHLASLGR